LGDVVLGFAAGAALGVGDGVLSDGAGFGA